jgi:hypothetical protein
MCRTRVYRLIEFEQHCARYYGLSPDDRTLGASVDSGYSTQDGAGTVPFASTAIRGTLLFGSFG